MILPFFAGSMPSLHCIQRDITGHVFALGGPANIAQRETQGLNG
jgi:hypothetical protein